MVQPASKRLVTEANTTLTGAAQKSANLSDLTSASTARTNLGLGTAATSAATDFLTPSTASVMFTATYSGGTAVRPTSNSSVRVFWVCTTSAVPPVVTTGTAGRYSGDIVSVVA